jgi:GNAT superfamily N-acetyltransferase
VAPTWLVGAVPRSATVPLRQTVLRVGRPVAESDYPGDDDPRTLHLGARTTVDGPLVAVGSVLPQAPPWDEARSPAWRIRGMAVTDEARGGGAGTAVLARLLDHVRAQGGGLVWCSARIRAVPLYERAGLERRGREFDAPFIGRHVHMWADVPGATPDAGGSGRL